MLFGPAMSFGQLGCHDWRDGEGAHDDRGGRARGRARDSPGHRARAERHPGALGILAKPPQQHPHNLDVLSRLRARDPGALLVARRDGRVVGTLIAAWDGWRGNMYRLAVAVDHRRRGVGLELVRAGERRLYECGARRVT